MTKYLFLLVSLVCCGFHLQAQFISLDTGTQSDAPVKPSIETTRSAFLEMNEALQKSIDRFIFTDLIQQTQSSGVEDGKFYLTKEQFYAFNAARKLQVIQQPAQYIVVASLVRKAPKPIKEAELNTYSAEKQKLIRENPDYIIVK